MSYAVRNDRQGWRSVSGPDDVESGEFYSDIPLEIIPIPATFQKALAELNAEYQADIQKLNSAYSMAILVDGASEAVKVLNIRAQYGARKDLHTANVSALKLQYGV